MGVKVITGFTGSPIWKYLYSFPQTTEKMVEDGYDEIVALWTPILDEFDKYGVKFALEVHPGEIAFDYYSTVKLLENSITEKHSVSISTPAICCGRA